MTSDERRTADLQIENCSHAVERILYAMELLSTDITTAGNIEELKTVVISIIVDIESVFEDDEILNKQWAPKFDHYRDQAYFLAG